MNNSPLKFILGIFGLMLLVVAVAAFGFINGPNQGQLYSNVIAPEPPQPQQDPSQPETTTNPPSTQPQDTAANSKNNNQEKNNNHAESPNQEYTPSFEFGSCPWDLDGNGVVGPGDVGIVKAHLGCNAAENPTCARYDFNLNGVVDLEDIQIVRDNFGPCNHCSYDLDGNGAVGPGDVGIVKAHLGCLVADNPSCEAYDFNSNGIIDEDDIQLVRNHFGPCQ